MKRTLLLSALSLFIAGALVWLVSGTRNTETEGAGKNIPSMESNAALPSGVWPLLPPRVSKRIFVDEAEFNSGLREAQKGDMESMLGLVDWYSRHGSQELADHWLEKLDEERKKQGLPTYLESLPPIMNGNTPVKKAAPTRGG